MNDRIATAMLSAVHAECAVIVEEEAERAAIRVKQRLAEIAPRLAMQMFEQFDVSRNETGIVIKVRNDLARQQ